MVNARRMQEILASERRQEAMNRRRTWHGGSPPAHKLGPQRPRFDSRGYSKPASVFPSGALTPDTKYGARPQEDLATAPRGRAGPAVRNQRYMIDTPDSSCPGSPELEEMELTSARDFQRGGAKHFVLPQRQSARRVVHAPEVVTYDHRCRETRLPHVKKQDPQDEYLERMAKPDASQLPPLRMSLAPRRRAFSGSKLSRSDSSGSASSTDSLDSQLSLHKYDTVEEGERQANPQTLNFRTVALPSGDTINVSFINEFNRHSYMPWAR